MNNNLYKCPICGGPTNYSSINYQPQPCLHCSATLKPAEHEANHGTSQSHGNLFAVHDASGKNVGHFEVDEKANKELVGATAETPRAVKEGYWHGQYQLMREKYYKQMGENSQQAERIKDLTFLVTELQPNRDYADRIRELEDQLKAKQGENHELYAMLGHIVDWSPELPYYMKDEYKTLFRNALAAARELLSKCSVKEGK